MRFKKDEKEREDTPVSTSPVPTSPLPPDDVLAYPGRWFVSHTYLVYAFSCYEDAREYYNSVRGPRVTVTLSQERVIHRSGPNE